MTFDPTKADINMEESQEFGEWVPPYGAFKANISDCVCTPKTEGGTDYIRTSKNGMTFIQLDLTIQYMRGDQEKTDFVTIRPGIWFPDEIKTLMETLKLDKEKAKDPKSYIGKDVTIIRRAREYYDGATKHIRSFQGKAVGEYNGNEYLITETFAFAPYKDAAKAADPGLLAEQEALFTAFREESGSQSSAPQTSNADEPATAEDVAKTFGEEEY